MAIWYMVLINKLKKENIVEANFTEEAIVQEVVDLMKEATFSHLMEFIFDVAPKILDNEISTKKKKKKFKKSLLQLSFHYCEYFFIQALVFHARHTTINLSISDN